MISFVPAELNETKVERDNRKANVSLGMILSNSLKLMFTLIFNGLKMGKVFKSNT